MLNDAQYPGLIVRLLVIFYDSLLLISICFIGTAVALFFTRGEVIGTDNLLFKSYLLAIGSYCTLWFWTHGGQTTGMAAWRIKLVNYTDNCLTAKHAVLRLILAVPLALTGLGFLWALVDKDKQTLYDRLAKTKLVYLPRNGAYK
jgi:uncharacterized RDD family membrane protein YckC